MAILNTPPISSLAFSDVFEISAFNPKTGLLAFKIYDSTSNELGITSDAKELTGKKGKLLYSTPTNIRGTVTGNTNYIEIGVLQAQTGGEMVVGDAVILVRETLVSVDGNTIKPTKEVLGESGQQFKHLEVKSTGKVYTQEDVASEEGYSYDVESNVITLPEGVVSNDKIYIIYESTVKNASSIAMDIDVINETYDFVMDGVGIIPCSNTGTSENKQVQVHFRGTIDNNFTIATSEADYPEQTYTINVVSGCDNNDFVTIITYDEDDIVESSAV